MSRRTRAFGLTGMVYVCVCVCIDALMLLWEGGSVGEKEEEKRVEKVTAFFLKFGSVNCRKISKC